MQEGAASGFELGAAGSSHFAIQRLLSCFAEASEVANSSSVTVVWIEVVDARMMKNVKMME